MVENYYLGIDLGTVRAAASHARPTIDDSVVVTQVQLGHRNDHMPSVVFVAPGGELLFGDTAERRGLAEPERLVREFTRNIGDDVPLSVGGRRLEAADLFARMVEFVISSATESVGSRPSGVTVTHPNAWGPHRVGVVRRSLDAIGLHDVDLLTAREAAVCNYQATHSLVPGHSVVTCDAGGTTYQTAVTRKEPGGAFALLGRPFGIDNLGGADFDDMVFRHVLVSCGASAMDLAGEDSRDALLQLRRECVDAKEALSFDTEVTIPVFLPQRATKIRLTRSEFEAMIEGHLDRMVGAVDDAVESAGIEISDVDAIVLVGGSARIPRIAQRLSEFFDRPIVLDQDPKASTAMGAARASLAAHGPMAASASTALAVLASSAAGTELVPAEEPDEVASLAVRDTEIAPGSSRGRWWAGVALATLAVSGLVLISGTLLSEFGEDDEVAPRAAAYQTPTTAAPSDSAAPTDAPPAPVPTPTPPVVVAPNPVSGDSQSEPTVRRETVKSYVTTESYTTVTATPASGTPTTQHPATTPPTQTTSSTPTTQSPDPTTPAPTTQTPDPTTPAPTTQTPDPTTPAPTTTAPDPTTPAPEPTTPAPDPTTPAPTTSEPDPTTPAPTTSAPDPTTSSAGPEITPV